MVTNVKQNVQGSRGHKENAVFVLKYMLLFVVQMATPIVILVKHNVLVLVGHRENVARLVVNY